MKPILMIAILLKAGRAKILAASVILVLLTACLDWLVGSNISLATLYIVPIMLGAVVMRPLEMALASLLCSYLRYHFDTAGSPTELKVRFVFSAIAYFLAGSFVATLVRNHELVVEHLSSIQSEQKLRREAEEQLRLLAESSPAAILTIDGKGTVLSGNLAAEKLFSIPEGETVRGRDIRTYLPVLADALRLEVTREGLRTAARCQGYRQNGDVFLAHIWFSSYATPEGLHLAAIAVDASEEMRDKEEQELRRFNQGNRIAAAAVAHEVRNFCGAIQMCCTMLRDQYGMADDAEFQRLDGLVGGLASIASMELHSKVQQELEHVHIRESLNDLRILIEAEWQEAGGVVHWDVPENLPQAIADPRGLLQAFLNLAQNSLRAVRGDGTRKELRIAAEAVNGRVTVRFLDSGPGVERPEQLFKPFQQGASGSGLGLYVSRVVVRSYGGDLRYERRAQGSCFSVELEAV
jgi:PAS domain S-box-containing protein